MSCGNRSEAWGYRSCWRSSWSPRSTAPPTKCRAKPTPTCTVGAHPQTLTLPTSIVLEKGQGLTSTITWNDTTDHIVSFGLQSTGEMGIIFGYYY